MSSYYTCRYVANRHCSLYCFVTVCHEAIFRNATKCEIMLIKMTKVRGRLDLPVPFTPSTPNRQNRNQVR